MTNDRALDQKAFDTLFLEARTYNGWLDKDVPDSLVKEIYDLMRWGPTSANCCPMRVVFVRTPEEKEKLKPMLDKGNQEKTMQAPVIALFANDRKFYDKMGKLAPHVDVEKWYGGKEALVAETATRNGTLQAGYFILAARAKGIDCGPMSGFSKDKVKEAYFPDLDGEVNFICSLGYGDPATPTHAPHVWTLTRRARLSDFSKPVLAFESSLGGCVASVINGNDAHSLSVETEREQAAKLMPMVQDVLAKAGVAFADIGLIVTTVGPGSFTGLRISLSAARTLGLALNLPVQGVSTLEAMARSAVPEIKPCLVILESKRTDFYVQAFDAYKNPLGEAACMEPDALREMIAANDFVLCGDGLVRLGMAGAERKLLNPEVLARAGLAIFFKNGLKAEKPEPVYLRGADVSMSNKVQRQINNPPPQ